MRDHYTQADKLARLDFYAESPNKRSLPIFLQAQVHATLALADAVDRLTAAVTEAGDQS